MNSIALIGLGLVLFFIVLLVQKKDKKQKDIFLALIFLFIGFELCYRFLDLTATNASYRFFIAFDLVYWALFGPAIYFYIQTLIGKYKFSKKDLLHLIPLALSLIPYVYFLVIAPKGNGLFYFTKTTNLFNQFLLFVLWDYTTPIYFVWAVWRLVKHKRHTKSFFSNVEGKNLNWNLWLCSVFLAYLIIAISMDLFLRFSGMVLDYPQWTIMIAVLNVFVFMLGIYGYKQEGIFSHYPEAELLLQSKYPEDTANIDKSYKTALKDEEYQRISNDLDEIMKTNKPFLDCDLNITQLATLLNTTLHKLSQVINETHQKNFFEFINEYRINEFVKLLKDPANNSEKIMSLAYDCGFNSKSAFYSAFKNQTGKTPTEYRKELQAKFDKLLSN